MRIVSSILSFHHFPFSSRFLHTHIHIRQQHLHSLQYLHQFVSLMNAAAPLLPHQFNYKFLHFAPIAALISTFVHCTTYLRTEILANEVVLLVVDVDLSDSSHCL